ncbi:hypothetical protein [Salmonirosea aquatica]|uniref:DUF1440 domain-containing protein n=1 Tax=Salmonirosea aquatica TaxID=2654236 RepID=A0A7C9B9K7_9BACT|nr:hypothetical protein [Cytophagaceae bacterium SJW1-29]
MKNNPVKEISTALGAGLIAGLAGTAAITISQMIEMKITKRKASDAPTKAVAKVLDIKPVNKGEKAKVAQEIHWTYGTAWGAVRGLLSLVGLTGSPATVAHFAGVWGTGLVMLPSLDIAPPITEEKPKAIAIDVLHHAVYAAAAGLVFDAIMEKDLW